MYLLTSQIKKNGYGRVTNDLKGLREGALKIQMTCKAKKKILGDYRI